MTNPNELKEGQLVRVRFVQPDLTQIQNIDLHECDPFVTTELWRKAIYLGLDPLGYRKVSFLEHDHLGEGTLAILDPQQEMLPIELEKPIERERTSPYDNKHGE